MIEHVERGDLGINAELLREVAQQLANLILLLEDVDAVEVNRSRVRILQGRDGAHQGTLACAIRTEKPKHVVTDLQRDILESFDAVRVGLGQT
jgi:hypothetical protein